MCLTDAQTSAAAASGHIAAVLERLMAKDKQDFTSTSGEDSGSGFGGLAMEQQR